MNSCLKTNDRGLWSTLVVALLLGVVGFVAVHCDPVVVGAVTTAPASSPATAPSTFGTGVGTGYGVRAVYNAGPAPLTGWFDARNVSSTRTDTIKWNFGDGNELYENPQFTAGNNPRTPPKVGANDSITGQVAGHWYEFPGTYRVTCTVTHPAGPASIYAATVVVVPDNRKQIYLDNAGSDATGNGTAAKPWKTAAKLSAAATSGGSNIHLGHNWIGTLGGTVIVGSSTVIQGDGTATIVPAVNCPALCGIGNGSTAHVLVWGVAVSSPAASEGCHVATVIGTDWSFIDCTIGTLGRGIYGHGVDGLLIQGCKQPVADSVASQVVYLDDVTRGAIAFNAFTGSLDESTVRVDVISNAVGGANGISFEHNLFAQPGQAKAALTFRGGSDVLSAGNVFVNAAAAYNVGIGNSTGSIENTRVVNVASLDDTIVAGGHPATFQIDDGVIGLTVSNLNFQGTANQAAVTIQPNWSSPATLTGIVIRASTFLSGKTVTVSGAPPVATPANGAAAGQTAWAGCVVQ